MAPNGPVSWEQRYRPIDSKTRIVVRAINAFLTTRIIPIKPRKNSSLLVIAQVST